MKYSLRDLFTANKLRYMRDDGTLNPLWDEEGGAWTIQDYHSIVGSVIDFTDDDWDAAAEEEWSSCEVADICDDHEGLDVLLNKERFGGGKF